MANTKSNNQTANTNVLTNKVIADIRKKAITNRDSFKTACNIFLELAQTDPNAKKVCAYLGITAESLKVKNRKETMQNVTSKFPLYYTKEDQDTYFPARLQKINKNAGINAFIAVPDTYINALLNLAKLLASGDKYESRKLQLTTATISEGESEYNENNVSFTAYDKNGVRQDAISQKSYIDYLNINRLANKAANIAKSEFFSQTKNAESETAESEE